jgi:1-acyl-sn-glycerol-3-phosphate acyltransferase
MLLMVLPRRSYWRFALACCRSAIAIVRSVAGIGYEVRGSQFLPEGPAILASKHQSAWDTLIFNVLALDCAYVVKRELLLIPFFGWALWRLGMIGVDRDGGARALKDLVSKAQRRLGEGRSIVIFPQGTRTPPGADRPYLVGVAAIYRQCGTPVVPVALNSGLFWPRRKLLKVSGSITVEFLPPIEPGLDRDTFMETLRERIEAASDLLEADARARLAPGADHATGPDRSFPV